MLEEFVGIKVVVDCQSHFVCLGLLKAYDDHFLDIRHCDLHDLRDTDSTRENYIASSAATGIKRNRKRVLLNRREVVGVSAMDDVVDG